MAYLMHFNPYHWGPGPNGGRFKNKPAGDVLNPGRNPFSNPYSTTVKDWDLPLAGVDRKTGEKYGDGSGATYTTRQILTDKGQQRYNYELQKNMQKPSNKRADPDALNDPNKWFQEDIENAKSTAEGFRDMTRYTGDLAKTFVKPAGKQRYDLSELSDAELRAILNREAMERQYSDYFAPKTVSKGEAFVKGMDVLGTVGSLGATALGIALSVQKLRGKGS